MLLMLGLVAGALWAQYNSDIVKILAARQEGPARILVFTQPAMRFSYTPTTRKAVITLANSTCSPDKKETCFDGQYDLFFIPQEKDQTAFWNNWKGNLTLWRFNPAPLFTYLHAYINAWVQKRTNIGPAEFILLSLEIPYLTVTDFAIEQPLPKKKTGRQSSKAQAPSAKPEVVLPNQNDQHKPLVVEILNASGKKGLALAVTQYLREQNAKGLLRVDVLQYDNYPTLQETSFITDYSGKLVPVTQVSHALGITSEIRYEQSSTAIYDSCIVLGKDFQMPI